MSNTSAKRCVVGLWLMQKSEVHMTQIVDMLADRTLTSVDLHAFFKALYGATFGTTATKDHRNHRCVCQ